MSSSSTRWVRPVLGLAVTAIFVLLLAREVEFGDVWSTTRRVSVGALLLAICCLALGYTIRIIRWWWMLRVLEPGVRLRACTWPFLVSISLNNLLPFRAGDAARVVGFRHELRSPAMRLLGTLVIERLLDLLTVLGFFFVGLAGVGTAPRFESMIRIATWIGALGILSLISLLLFSGLARRLVDWITSRNYVIERGWSETIGRQSHHLLGSFSLLRSPLLSAQLLALSVLVWTFEGAVFAVIALSMASGVTALAPWFAMATGTLATLLPSSPGYVGTFDYFTMLGLSAYGVEQDVATAFAVIVHIVLWLPLTLAGLIYFLLPGTRILRQRLARSTAAEREC